MDRIESLRIFSRVVQCGSFSKAAATLQIPRSSVSMAIQELEARVGARLLARTTRRVAPTQEGIVFYERCERLVGDYEDVEGLFRQSSSLPAGRLSVNVPGRMGRLIFAPALPDFLSHYPKIELEMGVTDRAVDLVHEGIDCAVRVGPLSNSNSRRPQDRRHRPLQLRKPQLSAQAWRSPGNRGSRSPSRRRLRLADQRTDRGMGMGRGQRRQITSDPGTSHRQQCRSLHRLLPGRAGTDPDPALRRATASRRRRAGRSHARPAGGADAGAHPLSAPAPSIAAPPGLRRLGDRTAAPARRLRQVRRSPQRGCHPERSEGPLRISKGPRLRLGMTASFWRPACPNRDPAHSCRHSCAPSWRSRPAPCRPGAGP